MNGERMRDVVSLWCNFFSVGKCQVVRALATHTWFLNEIKLKPLMLIPRPLT